MKKTFAVLMLALAFASCEKDKYEYKTNTEKGLGTLSFANLSIGIDDEVEYLGTRATEADGNYKIIITHSDGTVHFDKTYTEAKNAGGISLPATKDGESYTLVARNISTDIPAAAWEAPVYGATVEGITISAGEEKALSDITCTLLQHKVTVDYNDDFKNMVRGNCTTTVTYNNDSGSSLAYALTYDESTKRVTREERAGYFNVVAGGTTLEVTFSGKMDLEGNGNTKTYRMTKAFTDVKAKSWRHITFIKKIDEEGNATFDIQINDYAEDAPIEEIVDGTESTLGDDPNKPQGDGGIELISTCDFDITKNIIIPNVEQEGVVNMLLTMQANVPNGVRKFTVTISSTSQTFTNALDVVAEYDAAAGGHIVDLVNPTEKNMGIFEIVPFPHGSELNGKTTVDFNLSEAQIPLLAFPGVHTFVMTVIDAKGCTKDVTINMEVPNYANL